MRLLAILVLFVTACIGEAPPDPETSTGEEGADDSDDKSDTATISATVGTTARVVNTGGIGLRLRTAASSTASVIVVMPEGA
ncbi:MAG TPA: hypothetical protein VIV11_25430, partial [Kofleriaceae bacterium]